MTRPDDAGRQTPATVEQLQLLIRQQRELLDAYDVRERVHRNAIDGQRRALDTADSMLSLIQHRYATALPVSVHADLADACRIVQAITRARP